MTLAKANTEFDALARPPAEAEKWPDWYDALLRWRSEARLSVEYDPTGYGQPAFAWTLDRMTCGIVMLWDERFFDPAHNEFTVASFLEEAEREFGGYDVLILWHAYPRIGFDEQNQFDHYRNMPGGLTRLKELVRELHEHEVRVLLDYNPWDSETRREGVEDEEALARLVSETDADGLFLDTLAEAGPRLRLLLDSSRPGAVFQSEMEAPLEAVASHNMSWLQWPRELETPQLFRNKWFEQRHMQYLVRRWHRDHREELHAAWLGGVGIVVWDNVFGVPMPWSPEDRLLLLRTHAVQKELADFFTTGEWFPLVPTGLPSIASSEWVLPGARLVTMVNQSTEPVAGRIALKRRGGDPTGTAYLFSALRGWDAASVELTDDALFVDIELAGRDAGAFVSWAPGLSPTVSAAVLGLLHQFESGQEASFVTTSARGWRRPPPVALADIVPQGMLEVSAQEVEIVSSFLVRECGDYEAPAFDDVEYPELGATRTVSRRVALNRFAIDIAPVTREEFALFVRATGYRPAHDLHFLESPEAPDGRVADSAPVVNIDLEDARAYARWRGKRLPTEYEWQHALQTSAAGYGSRRVWEWTESEASDGFNRFCILKGGSDLDRSGSSWYAEAGPQSPRHSAKFLLFWPGSDRMSTIGFRCAVDLPALASSEPDFSNT